MGRPGFYFILIVCGMVLVGCDTSKNPVGETTTPDDFALFFKVGTEWIYELADTTANLYRRSFVVSKDTLSILVREEIPLEGCDRAVRWVIFRNGEADSMVVCQQGDSAILFFREDRFGRHLWLRFPFPLLPGRTWAGDFADYSIDRVSRLELPSGEFFNVIRVKEIERQGNSAGFNAYYLDPRFGILKFYWGTIVTLFEVNHLISWDFLKKKD
ncbi:MAG: hypothetical protein D6715_09550 [Calditrichaeota bacterium]|nr:MAG: hypothetical protein D6715_09550 [Calditrichota bacterium]